ncbi:MAG: helicase-related protein [Patescibacteria group bacterium]
MAEAERLKNWIVAAQEKEPMASKYSLWARLLIADARGLDHTTEIKPGEVSVDQFPSLLDRNYRPVHNKNTYDRNSFWRHKAEEEGFDDTYENAMDRWYIDTEQKMKRWWVNYPDIQPYLIKTLGVDQPEDIDRKVLEGFYKKTFLDPAQTKDGKEIEPEQRFIDSLLKSFKYDSSKIQANEEIIKELCKFWGKEYKKDPDALDVSSQTITGDEIMFESIKAEAALHNNRNATIAELITHLEDIVPGSREAKMLESLNALPLDREDMQTDLLNLAEKHDTSLLIARTASGKTIVAPLVLANDPRFADYIFLGSGPTQGVIEGYKYARKAALDRGMKELSEQISWEHGDADDIVPNERIRFMTEGILRRRLQNLREPGKFDEKVGVGKNLFLLFDEAHLLTTEGLQAYDEGIKLQKEHPGRVKILFMTATANKEVLVAGANIQPEAIMNVEVPKRYKIDLHFAQENERANITELDAFTPERLATAAFEKIESILEIHKDDVRNIGVAAPGKDVIKNLDSKLKEFLKKNHPNIEVVWITGDTTPEQRQQADLMAATRGKRTIFLATNAIKTGKTLEGITDVVVIPFDKKSIYQDEIGDEDLVQGPMSEDDFVQWFGRTGRTNDGRAHILYLSESDFYHGSIQKHPEHTTKIGELTGIVLTRLVAGYEVKKNSLMTEMPLHRIEQGKRKLKLLDAIDEHGVATDIGKRMDQLPVDYNFARAIVEAERIREINPSNPQADAREEVVTITQVLMAEGKGLFSDLHDDPDAEIIQKNRLEFYYRPDGTEISGSDELVRLNIWRKYDDIEATVLSGKILTTDEEKEQFKKDLMDEQIKWCKKYGISHDVMEAIRKGRKKLLERVEIDEKVRGNADLDLVEYSFARGFYDKLLKFNKTKNLYELYFNPQAEEYDNMTEPPLLEVGDNKYSKKVGFTPTTIFPRNADHEFIVTMSIRTKKTTGNKKSYRAGISQRYDVKNWDSAAA